MDTLMMTEERKMAHGVNRAPRTKQGIRRKKRASGKETRKPYQSSPGSQQS